MEKFTQAPVGLDIDQTVSSNSQAIENLNGNKFATVSDYNLFKTTEVFQARADANALNPPDATNPGRWYALFVWAVGPYVTQIAHSVTNNMLFIRGYYNNTWTAWQELETAKKYSVASKTISSIAPNNNGSVMIDMPSDGSVIKEIIPYGFLPSDHWNSSLIFVSVNNSTRTVAYRCVGSGNSQTFDMRYAVIYE